MCMYVCPDFLCTTVSGWFSWLRQRTPTPECSRQWHWLSTTWPWTAVKDGHTRSSLSSSSLLHYPLLVPSRPFLLLCFTSVPFFPISLLLFPLSSLLFPLSSLLLPSPLLSSLPLPLSPLPLSSPSSLPEVFHAILLEKGAAVAVLEGVREFLQEYSRDELCVEYGCRALVALIMQKSDIFHVS